MRERLTEYVGLLFAGTTDTDEIRQEILQNTLDRYDDLVAQGKTPEAAYRLAISGIGDIGEILEAASAPQAVAAPEPMDEKGSSKLITSIAVALYILCPVPLFLLQNELGLCLLLFVVAVATVLLVIFGKDEKKEKPAGHTADEGHSPENQLRKAVSSVVWLVGTIVYFGVSLATGAWWITWLIFLMTGSISGICNAIIDLKEACRHEN